LVEFINVSGRGAQMREEAGELTAVFIVDPNPIFRLGMATCLDSLEPIRAVGGSDSVGDAWARPELARADLVIVDAAAPDVREFVRDLRVDRDTPSLVSGSDWQPERVASVVEAGAIGVLEKRTLTPATLEANVRAALLGAAVLPSDLVADVVAMGSDEVDANGILRGGQLSEREQEVLRLIADGHATREVAAQLCYSERTIKNVLHDVAMKFGARSRSHAVAHAVREGLI
jgi:DNA-binding NarL/FixJ family response regulator